METFDDWTDARKFEFEALMGLRKGLKACRGMRRQFTEDEEMRVAKAIREQFDLSGWRYGPGPGVPLALGHSGRKPDGS